MKYFLMNLVIAGLFTLVGCSTSDNEALSKIQQLDDTLMAKSRQLGCYRLLAKIQKYLPKSEILVSASFCERQSNE